MITFIRHLDGQLFTVQSGSTEPGFMAYFSSTVLDKDIVEITINESWTTYIGFYIFLKDTPDINDMFLSALSNYFEAQAPDTLHTSFAWLVYDSGSASIASGTMIHTVLPDERVTLASDTDFRFANYTLPLKQTAPVNAVTDSNTNIIGFDVEYPPYEGAPPPSPGRNLHLPLSGEGRGALQGQVSLSDLSAKTETGWNASLYYVIANNGQQVAQHYPLFEVKGEEGLQILFDYRLDPVDPLNPDRSYLAFTGTVFSLQKNEEGNWFIAQGSTNELPSFFRTVYGKKISLIPLVESDRPPKLVFEALPPVDGRPRYYLAPDGDFELAIQGASARSGPATDQLLCGLSGVESVAFTSKSADSHGSVMRFMAKQSAYAPQFPIFGPPGESVGGSAKAVAKADEIFNNHLQLYKEVLASGDRALLAKMTSTTALLDSTFKTSWINIRPNPAQADPASVPIYYAQPTDAALYRHDHTATTVSSELLQVKDTAAAFFPANITQPIPIVPYAGVRPSDGFGHNELQQFENQILVASRREAVSQIPLEVQTAYRARKDTGKLVTTTTPQGLLATVPEQGINWESVLLAKSESKGKPYALEFKDGVTKELRDVMQSNQLFLVASEAAPLGTFSNQVTIADWPFTINVGKGSSQGLFSNILIFKFAEGTLEERVKDPKSWGSAAIFNTNPILVSKWITSYIESAKLLVKTDSRYANFLQIVRDPHWNGILALKVDISVQHFPDDLKGLLAGINRDEFYAHHLGIEINFIQPDADGQLSLPKSSLFALINYVDRDYRTNQDIQTHLQASPFTFSLQDTPSPVTNSNGTDALYDFRVLTLQVVFTNSEIQDFTSKIQLTTTAWFDEAAQLQIANMGDSLRQQTIEFNGSYEKHNGVNTYTFVTRPDQTYKFLLESQTINYVEIVKAQFYTITDQLTPPSDANLGADQEAIAARFMFWGYLNFKRNESFDLFSFGDADNAKQSFGTGLYFANLGISMDFLLDNASGVATNRVFGFDPHRMSFDTSKSTPRVNSLFSNFPINLAGLIYSTPENDAKPSDLGYLPVAIQSPTPIGGQVLTEKWYSLLYDLNLGSMGALAAKAGFVSQISTAWSPDAAVKRLTTGIKLPGVGGQKTLSLQSVLSIHIQSFTFLSAYEDEANEKLAYTLKFNNVKLSLLGMKLPGAADTQFILFGDPEGADKTTLAWYAAYYAKPKKPTTLPPPIPRGLSPTDQLIIDSQNK